MTKKRELRDPDPLTPGRLTSAEAAKRLGVKRQTLYAYVSRGVLGRETAADGRSSLFDAAEIDSLRRGRGRADEGEFVTVINTAITRVDDEGLWIRGRDLTTLVARPFEEVADILWQSDARDEHDGEQEPAGHGYEEGDADAWVVDEDAREQAARLQAAMPINAEGLDRMRATLALASALDPMRHDLSPRSVCAAGRAMIGLMVDALPARCEAQGTSIADRLWAALSDREGTSAQRQCLNAAMVLLVDHGLATSNFAARLAGSARADPYSVVCAGLGVVGGTLHGAASANVHELLHDTERMQDAAAAVGDARRRLARLPGHGHKVYTTRDPRYETLMVELRRAWRGDPRLHVIGAVREVIAQRTGAIPNIDSALGALTYLANMRPRAGEVVFALSRTAGWLAHAAEEYGEAPLRFRARARYVGELPA